jgi:hypothetical protein
VNRPRKIAGLIPQGPAADKNGEQSAPLTPESREAYINRELSWLDFARRVMALAQDRTVPLLERVKFAGIMGMLYDEFAMKRIGGLRRRIESKNTQLSPDGRTPREELQLCREELTRQRGSLGFVLLSRRTRRQGRPVGPSAAGRNRAGPGSGQHYRHGQRRAHGPQIRRNPSGRD